MTRPAQGRRNLAPASGRLAVLTVFVAVLATMLTLLPAAPAAAATTYQVTGAEIFATSEEGIFVGTASRSGGIAGAWYADVLHEPLEPHGAIHGGSFAMLLTSAPHTVTGQFRSGQVRQVRSGRNCTNQRYSVTGRLRPVAAGVQRTAGRFGVVLTHLRSLVLGRCVTYGATVEGSVIIG